MRPRWDLDATPENPHSPPERAKGGCKLGSALASQTLTHSSTKLGGVDNDMIPPCIMVRVVVTCVFLVSVAAWADDDSPPAASDGLDRLVAVVKSGSSFKVRATAAVALGRMGDPRVVPVLAEVMHSDDSYAVRAAAAAALGRVNDISGIAPLLEALHDNDEYVRNEVSDALDRFHGAAHLFAFRDYLQSDDPLLRLAAVRAYGDFMRDPQSSVGVAAFVVNALGDDDETVAAAAETALSSISHERAVPLLVSGLGHSAAGVRASCARLVEKRRDPRAVAPLSAIVLSTDETEDVRRPARAALKAHIEFVDVSRYALDAADPQKVERTHALRLIAAVSDPRALPLVELFLRDTDPTLRMAGARAAVDFGGPKARSFVEQASAKEPDPRQKRNLENLLRWMR